MSSILPCGPLIDHQRRQQQTFAIFRSNTSSPLLAASVLDGVGVVTGADVDPDCQALDAHRRRLVKVQLQQADRNGDRDRARAG